MTGLHGEKTQGEEQQFLRRGKAHSYYQICLRAQMEHLEKSRNMWQELCKGVKILKTNGERGAKFRLSLLL
jgi:hypothetical protein